VGELSFRAVGFGRSAVEYVAAWDLQRQVHAAVVAGAPDTVLLLEHPPVFTAGKRTEPHERPVGDDVPVIDVDRGGKITFHGPGQLVGYPLLDLGGRPDAAAHLRRMEEVVLRAAADLGVALQRRPEVQTGVWAGDRKVCAIGVRLMRARVTLHGFAVNCGTDLSWFEGIVPCGLAGHGVTSLSELAGHPIDVKELLPPVVRHAETVFDVRFVDAPLGFGELSAPAVLTPLG
jgi:lipoyl(octanoyl) transferase